MIFMILSISYVSYDLLHQNMDLFSLNYSKSALWVRVTFESPKIFDYQKLSLVMVIFFSYILPFDLSFLIKISCRRVVILFFYLPKCQNDSRASQESICLFPFSFQRTFIQTFLPFHNSYKVTTCHISHELTLNNLAKLSFVILLRILKIPIQQENANILTQNF